MVRLDLGFSEEAKRQRRVASLKKRRRLMRTVVAIGIGLVLVFGLAVGFTVGYAEAMQQTCAVMCSVPESLR
jgi:hypothetical protein